MNKIIKYVKNPHKIVLYLDSKGCLNWLPDKMYLSILYRIRIGSRLNWNNPIKFSEKIQYMKLYCQNEVFKKMVDKYEVREYISKIIGREYLIPLIGCWKSTSDIDIQSLPNSFVIKCTHNSGGVHICTNKLNFDFNKTFKDLNHRLKHKYYKHGREWQYRDIVPKIIAEELIQTNDGNCIQDYKFFCFQGKVKTILVCSERFSNIGLCEDFFDVDWNHLPVARPSHPFCPHPINKPNNLNKMIEIAEKLSTGFPFLRIDLYDTGEKVYFGEITLYPASGLESFIPEDYDFELGSYLLLDNV